MIGAKYIENLDIFLILLGIILLLSIGAQFVALSLSSWLLFIFAGIIIGIIKGLKAREIEHPIEVLKKMLFIGIIFGAILGIISIFTQVINYETIIRFGAITIPPILSLLGTALRYFVAGIIVGIYIGIGYALINAIFYLARR